MKQVILKLILMFAMLATGFAQTHEEKSVVVAFENYKAALLNDNGEEAIKYVDKKTIAYYEGLLQFIKKGDSTTTTKLSAIDKFMVFSIRHRVPRQDILSFTGKSLLTYSINNGMVGKSSIRNNSIGKVTIEGDSAKGEFFDGKENTGLYFNFYKEDVQWKINLTSLFKMANGEMYSMISKSGKNENDFLLNILETITGRKPGPEVWRSVQ